jgi:hypothetical protein
MIGIEGIPVVAARLAEMLKSTKALEASRLVGPHQMQERQFTMVSAIVRTHRPRRLAKCAHSAKEKGNASVETRSDVLSIVQNGDAGTP